MTDLIVRLVAILAGTALAIQPPINARLRVALGDPFWASFVSFVVGAIGLAVIALIVRAPFPTFAGVVRETPWWVWTGGLFGVLYVTVALIVVPRIGATALLSLAVLGMMLAAIAIDQTGTFGITVRHISLPRILGAVSVVAGVVLISRF
ncbi:MAG: DMT family transporter [Vulcanimicrobiaceae bacterium]